MTGGGGTLDGLEFGIGFFGVSDGLASVGGWAIVECGDGIRGSLAELKSVGGSSDGVSRGDRLLFASLILLKRGPCELIPGRDNGRL